MQTTFAITLETMPGFLAPAERRLARFLKAAKRGYGFRCTECRPVAVHTITTIKKPATGHPVSAGT
jgi:hypothetical protein